MTTDAANVPASMREFRDFLACRFLGGKGIEIGAGNSPVRTDPVRAQVTYVDFAPRSELVGKHGYPADWVEADVIEDGTQLPSFQALDFIIACHVLEHTEDPISVLDVWLAKLNPGAVLFLAIPHRDYCFDHRRPLTTTEHLLMDHKNAASSRYEHLREWALLVENVEQDAVAGKVADLIAADYRIHYHVWDTESFAAFLAKYCELRKEVHLELCGRNETEVIAILRKSAT